jgi:RND family efflux transporter MFP subunit
MSMTRWWKAASLLLVAGATVSGAGLLAIGGGVGTEPRVQQTDQPGPGATIPVAPVNVGRFKIAVDGRGSLEAEKREHILNSVEGQTKILSVLPEGTSVKKGDIICELDSSLFRGQLTNQMIASQSADAAFQNAVLTREVAEIALKEYEEGIYLQDRSAVLGEIKLAEETLRRDQGRLDRSRLARQKLGALLARREGATTSADILAELDVEDRTDAAELASTRGKFALEAVQSKLNLLENYTKPKTIKVLRSEVEKARHDEWAKKQHRELEQERLTKLEKQIRSCTIQAPHDGVILYARSSSQPAEPSAIGMGATVRERQILFQILEPGAPMRVNAKIPESKIDRIQKGQKVRVTIDAFSGKDFAGLVTDIAPLPDPTVPGDNRKVYTTLIRLEDHPPLLRPGFTATVEIVISERDGVLTIPIKALPGGGPPPHVAVKMPDGRFEWREVKLGEGNDARVVVEQGLKPGDQVATDFSELFRKGMKIGKPPEPTKP